ncbi:hypothetical protein HN011_002164 [Eciton burchellii]|nr:hypothetical protein HN011_002164 [Eciton burchellii]
MSGDANAGTFYLDSQTNGRDDDPGAENKAGANRLAANTADSRLTSNLPSIYAYKEKCKIQNARKTGPD